MSKIDEKDTACCKEDTCTGVESCDCQGICTCEPEIDFEEVEGDCDDCCCGDDDDDDDDCDEDDLECDAE